MVLFTTPRSWFIWVYKTAKIVNLYFVCNKYGRMAVLLNGVIVYSSSTSQNVLVVLINFHLSKYVDFIILITAFYFVHKCVLCVSYPQKCCFDEFLLLRIEFFLWLFSSLQSWFITGFFKKINTTGTTIGAESAYHSGAHEFTHQFCGVSVAQSWVFCVL